jgi:hypothetical protein
MAITQSISPLFSLQTIRCSRAAKRPRILAQDLRDLTAADSRIDRRSKKARKAV